MDYSLIVNFVCKILIIKRSLNSLLLILCWRTLKIEFNKKILSNFQQN